MSSTHHEANVVEGTLTSQRNMMNMANVKHPKELYNGVRVQKNTKICKISKCNSVTLYLSAFAKILQKDVNRDQKRHQVDTRDSATHEKSFEATKSIFAPKLSNISIRIQTR